MKTQHIIIGLAAIGGALVVYAIYQRRRAVAGEAAAVQGFGVATGLSNVPWWAGGIA